MNKTALIKWFLDLLEEVQPGNQNIDMYRALFTDMSEKEFAQFMDDLANKRKVLPWYCSNLTHESVDNERALQVAEKLGIEMFQQIWITDNISGVVYLTPEKYFINHQPIRRQAQHVTKGKSVTEDDTVVDITTGQPTGDSKSSRISLPELHSLDSMGLHKNIEELINVRGGNQEGYAAAKRSMLDTGHYNLETAREAGGTVTSTQTLRSYLLAMHLDNNVTGGAV